MSRRLHGSNVSAFAFAVTSTALAVAGCSSSSSSATPPRSDAATDVTVARPDGGGPGTEGGGGDAGPCTSPSAALAIRFSPMYSAYVTDSKMQTFAVPAIVTGGTGTATWSASDQAAVSFAPDLATGGTLMTINAATPAVTITARIGSECTTATLNVTSAVEADWAAGNARYNNGVPIVIGCIDQKVKSMLPPDSGITLPGPPDGGCPDAGPSCTSCHGSNPTGGFFTGVQHTPEQTAGFSDQQLIDVIVKGVVNDGGAFDPNILPYPYWQAFHTWTDINTPAAQKAMVVYLRSLTPIANEGGVNFGQIQDSGLVGD